eukprot:466839_1
MDSEKNKPKNQFSKLLDDNKIYLLVAGVIVVGSLAYYVKNSKNTNPNIIIGGNTPRGSDDAFPLKPTINNVEFIKNEDIKKLLDQIIDEEMKNIPQIVKKQCADLCHVTDTNTKTLPQSNCNDIAINAIAISFGTKTKEQIQRLAFEKLKESIGTRLDEKLYNQYKPNQYKQCINQLVNKKFEEINAKLLQQMK